jgi:hypothetical protein
MPPHGSALCSRIRPRNNNITVSARWVSIASVSLHHLTREQHVLQVPPVDVDVRPFSSRKWSVDPNNVSTLDAYSNFIPQGSMFELVRVVLPVAAVRSLSGDLEVSSINCHLTGLSSIRSEAILPSNLQVNSRQSNKMRQLCVANKDCTHHVHLQKILMPLTTMKELSKGTS